LRPALKGLLGLFALAAAIGAFLYGVDFYRHRFVRTNTDLMKLLPPGDLTVFFLDLSKLRQAGLLGLLAGVRPAAEADYQAFLSQTGFDYRRDMDALAGALDGDQLFFAIRGRFDWTKLKQYALAHSGVCERDYCTIPGSKPDRWVNFLPIQSDVMGLSISANGSAADVLRPPGRRVQDQPPADPVWLKVSQSLLKNPSAVPMLGRMFAIVLQSANSVVFSLGTMPGLAAGVRLNAAFPNNAAADTARTQMEMQTKLLKLELTREHQPSSPSDLTGLLTAGSFQVVEKHLIGIWPVRNELLRELQ
jgi:hypothetical protein